MTLERQDDELVDQRAKAYGAVLPHLRIHADRGEAGDGIDLVDIQLAGGGFQQKIDAPHALAFHRAVAFHRQAPQGREATGSSFPRTAHSSSRPTMARSTITLRSYCAASATAVSNSARLWTFEMPTEEPRLAGLTNIGKGSWRQASPTSGFCRVTVT